MDILERYIEAFSSPQGGLLDELERATNQRAVHPQMLSGRIQGGFLRLLVSLMHPRRVLEIGTFTGYSALCMAAGLEDGARLDTVEADDELEETILSFFARSGFADRLHLHIGSALEVCPHLGGTYDLVFVDGDKREYPAYLRMLLGDAGNEPLVASGSCILADNILWYGKVASPDKYDDPHTAAIVEFNRMVAGDDRLENVILPLRDGLNMIRVK